MKECKVGVEERREGGRRRRRGKPAVPKEKKEEGACIGGEQVRGRWSTAAPANA